MEDEFVYMLEGEVVLIEDDGETVLKPGDAAGFKANGRNGHHLVNRIDPATPSIWKSARARSMSAPNIPTSILWSCATTMACATPTRTANRI